MQLLARALHEVLRGRLLGHPIHAMLVHFPSALFPTTLLFDIVSYIFEDALFALIAYYILGLGVISGVIAACFGAIDYVHLPPQHTAWKKASTHAVLNVIWLIVFATLFGINSMDYPHLPITSLTQLIIVTLSVGGLIFSNYLGGELVYRHHIGSVE